MLALAARRLTVTRTIDRNEVQEGRPITLRFAVGGLRGLPVQVAGCSDTDAALAGAQRREP